jgi:hypothetical protein
MRTLTAALVFLMLASLTAGHVETRPAVREADRRVPAYAPAGAIPVSAPAGAEFLLAIR